MGFIRTAVVAAAALVMVGSANLAFAQDNNNGGGGQGQQQGDRGNRGGGGNFDPAQFRQRMAERMKEQLGASDDEWKAIEPRLEKVMNAQRDARAGGFGFGFGGRGGPGGGGDRGGDRGNRGFGGFGNQDSPVAKAQQDLRTTLDNKDASADQVSQKLEALRKAREEAKANLTKAQAELKEILTARQEAQLVMMGMLE